MKLEKLKILSPRQRQQLERAKSMVTNLGVFGRNAEGKPWSEVMSKDIDHVLEMDKTPDENTVKDFIELYKDAHGGDKKAQAELMALRIVQTINYVTPNLHAGMFFDVIELGPDERPAIQQTTKQELGIRYVGQDGPNNTEVRIKPVTSETLVDLVEIVTDKVEYPTNDIYLGDISRISQAQFDLDFDLQNKWDGIQWGLLQASIGNFTLTGKLSDRVYNQNSRIQSSQLPLTNDVDIPGTLDGTNRFGQGVFQAVLDYAAGWSGTSSDGELTPTGELVMNPKDASAIITGLNYTNATQNSIGQDLLRKGWFELPALFNIPWKVVPDATLARKKLYARFNKPAGTIWLKKSRFKDVEKVDDMMDFATRFKKMCFGSAILNTQRPNVVRVRYQT
jgi:hypothetical protein